MALLPMDEVAGGDMADQPAMAVLTGGNAWSNVQKELGDQPVSKLSLRALPQKQVIEVTTPGGVRLFDANDGRPILIDDEAAKSIASAAHPSDAAVTKVAPLKELTLPVREHELQDRVVQRRDAVALGHALVDLVGCDSQPADQTECDGEHSVKRINAPPYFATSLLLNGGNQKSSR